ncbi:MAG TPA: TIGR00730 family Rossman fold protein [Vicinamibacteria bacterium]
MRRVCVFCGSSPGRDPRYAAAAAALGRALATRGLGLVFGGGSVGLMGVLADHALAAGGRVTGVIPHGLAARELAHRGVEDTRVVPTMHARKALMAELADGFVALPGGIGTFEELFEILTWGQLGIHRKPVGVLNVAGYYDPLEALLDHAVAEGFVSAVNRRLVIVDSEGERLLDRLASHEPPPGPAWITPAEA